MGTEKVNETIEVLLEEYRTLSAEILKRVEFQQRLMNYELITAGAILSILIQIALSSELSGKVLSAVKYFMVLAPYIFLFFSWSFSRHDLMIIELAKYKELVIKPAIRRLVGSAEVLAYEEYLSIFRQERHKKYGVLVKIEQGSVLPLLVGIVLIVVYFIAFISNEIASVRGGDFNSVIRMLLCFGSICLLARTAWLGFVIPRNYIEIPSGEGDP
ncbi:MAG: hypothetical protein K9L20_11820 [Desulfarculaceae bacterium]|nr:hypothetical protein [Desulfarculaceae bacterium]MCF8122719.1 hypothetical protein [Desulfarculaceae bacterium]